MTNAFTRQGRVLTPHQLIDLFNLSDDAEFIGNVILVEESSVYLSSIRDHHRETLPTYDTRREYALVYSSYQEAEADAIKLNKSTRIGFLFDLSDELKVFTENDINKKDNHVLSQ